MPDLGLIKIAIIGLESESADVIRKQLYRLSYPFKGLKIADLGNIRKCEPVFLAPVIKELVSSNILPILIGTNPSFTEAQFQAYSSRKLISLTMVDEKIQLSKRKKQHYLSKMLYKPNSNLFNLTSIGDQAHYTSAETIRILNDNYFERASLGKVRSNIEMTEPLVRDADIMSFNISAIRYADVPAQLQPSASGLFCEEACQISRYAGLSDKLSSIGFYGLHPDKNGVEQSAQVVAQLIWYFVDGYHHRKNDFPASTDGLIEYIVEWRDQEEQLTFWKSKKSGRWWMQIPVKVKKRHQRHKLLPCSYSDYLAACNNDLPDRLLNAYKRFS